MTAVCGALAVTIYLYGAIRMATLVGRELAKDPEVAPVIEAGGAPLLAIGCALIVAAWPLTVIAALIRLAWRR